MISSTYKETLTYLYSLLPMYQRQGQPAFKKDLRNTILLCEALGNPQNRFSSIHVGGTNGKGSVTAMLHSIGVAAGYKVGLYTSPHLIDFRERIRVNTANISEREVIAFVQQHQSLIEQIQPSFFEFTVVMAFDHFARHQVDWAIIEVGLGGRLDSTNVIRPALSVITNISYDHMDMLGETLPEIAGEKAGIIKPGIPVVIGQTHEETQEVFRQKATTEQAPIFFADQLIETRQIQFSWPYASFGLVDTQGNSLELEMDLVGTYQAHNLATTWVALDQLTSSGFETTLATRKQGLKQVKPTAGLRGRMERLLSHPSVWIDTAHNLDSVQAALYQLNQLPTNRLHIVWGMVKEKDHEAIMRLLPRKATYYFVRPDVPRGLDQAILQEKAERIGLKGTSYQTVKLGLAAALKAADQQDIIWVSGSTFVVAEILTEWDTTPPEDLKEEVS